MIMVSIVITVFKSVLTVIVVMAFIMFVIEIEGIVMTYWYHAWNIDDNSYYYENSRAPIVVAHKEGRNSASATWRSRALATHLAGGSQFHRQLYFLEPLF